MPHDPAIIDVRQLLAGIEGDVRLMRELAILFRTSSVKHRAQLATAVEKQNAVDIRSAAHAFKGSAGGMRALELWDVLAGIEAAARAGDLPTVLAHYACVGPAMDRLLGQIETLLARIPE